MIDSHRTPATFLMTAGGLFFLIALAVPFFLQGDLPAGISTATLVLKLVAIPLFVGGACSYARGVGYPFWLGIFAITLVGLLILMLLPDRREDG